MRQKINTNEYYKKFLNDKDLKLFEKQQKELKEFLKYINNNKTHQYKNQ